MAIFIAEISSRLVNLRKITFAMVVTGRCVVWRDQTPDSNPLDEDSTLSLLPFTRYKRLKTSPFLSSPSLLSLFLMAAAASAVAPIFPIKTARNPRLVVVERSHLFLGLQQKRVPSIPNCSDGPLVPTWSTGPWYSFLGTNGRTMQSRYRVRVNSVGEERSSGASPVVPSIVGVLHLVVSLGLILVSDKFLKRAFVAASIKFPSALFGMFCVFTVLMVLDSALPSAAKGLVDFFEPANLFIQRWLPLFYVPSLVILPLAIRDIPAASSLKICFILVGGWLASLFIAGFTALTVRRIVKTQMIAAEPMAKPSPFSSVEVGAWTVVFILSFVLALVVPMAFGTTALTRLPFLLAATVLGYMIGSCLPSNIKKIFHPIICCALSADLAALAFGYFSKAGIDAVLGDYLTKVASNPGAGDILMGFLGSVIISFAFSMFKQRKLVKRHAAEIFSSVVFATIFSLYSTAFMGRFAGLEPTLTVSILPRCITVALALSIVSLFEGTNASLTAAVVVLTGLVGANFVQAVLDKLGMDDPIARGIATASSAHGLGTAALSAKEPEALPFCAIAYALTGIFGSLICSVPAVRQSLLMIAG